MWLSSGDFREVKTLLDNRLPLLQTAIDYAALAQKWYWWLAMPCRWYHAMDVHNYIYRHCILTLSVPPAEHGIALLPPSPDQHRLIPSISTPTQIVSNIWGLLIDMAEDGSGDSSSCPANIESGTICSTPTETGACPIAPASTRTKDSTITHTPANELISMILPTDTEPEATTALQMHSYQTIKDTQQPYWPSTAGSGSGSSDSDTANTESASCILD